MTWPPNSADVGSAFSVLVQSVGEVITAVVASVLMLIFFIRSFPSIFKFFVDTFILKVHENKYADGRLVAVRVRGRNGMPDRWVEVNEDGTRLEKRRVSDFSKQKSVTADFKSAAKVSTPQRRRVPSYEVGYYSSDFSKVAASSSKPNRAGSYEVNYYSSSGGSAASSSASSESRDLKPEDFESFRSVSGRRSSSPPPPEPPPDFGPPPSDDDYGPPPDYDY